MSMLAFVLAAAASKEALLARVDEIRPRMLAVNQAIWSYAEPGLEEVRSSKELRDWLGESGFEVRADVAGAGEPAVVPGERVREERGVEVDDRGQHVERTLGERAFGAGARGRG